MPERAPSWPLWALDKSYFLEIMERSTESLMGIVWFYEVSDSPDVYEVHAVVKPEYRSRWLDRETLGALFSFKDHVNAKTLIAQVTSSKVESIWRRLGFKIVGNMAYDTINE